MILFFYDGNNRWSIGYIKQNVVVSVVSFNTLDLAAKFFHYLNGGGKEVLDTVLVKRTVP